MKTINWKKRESTIHDLGRCAPGLGKALKKTLPKYIGRGPYFEREFIGFEPKGILVKATYSID